MVGPDFYHDQVGFDRRADQFDALGYKLLPGALPTKDVEKALRVLESCRKTLFSVDLFGLEFLSDTPVVAAWLSRLLGPGFRRYYGHLLIVAPGEAPPTSNWHIDNRPTDGSDAVKAHFYLTDIDTEAAGAPLVIPGSVGCLEKPRGQGVPILARAGDVLLTRPDLWHRSTPNTSNVIRKSVHLSFSRRLA